MITIVQRAVSIQYDRKWKKHILWNDKKLVATKLVFYLKNFNKKKKQTDFEARKKARQDTSRAVAEKKAAEKRLKQEDKNLAAS